MEDGSFSYSLAQWAMVQAIHLYFKLNHNLTQACNISGASKMFKLLVLRTSWNASFLFKPWILLFHHELSLQECTPHSTNKSARTHKSTRRIKNPISACQHQKLTPDWNNTHWLFIIYMGKLFSSWFGQKVSKIQDWLMLFQICAYYLLEKISSIYRRMATKAWNWYQR